MSSSVLTEPLKSRPRKAGRLRANDGINKNCSIEGEVGARSQERVTNGQSSPSLDLLATAGYRYDFQ